MSAENIARLHEPAEAEGGDEPIVPGIDVGFMCNIAENHQLQLRTMVPADTPDHVVNQVLDRMSRFAERQKAKATVFDLEHERKNWQQQLTQFQLDQDAAEQQCLRKVALEEEAIKELERQLKDIETSARIEHSANGRQGQWKPVGKVAQQLKLAQQSVQAHVGAIEKAAEDKQKEVANLQMQVTRLKDRIGQIDREIERLRALIG